MADFFLVDEKLKRVVSKDPINNNNGVHRMASKRTQRSHMMDQVSPEVMRLTFQFLRPIKPSLALKIRNLLICYPQGCRFVQFALDTNLSLRDIEQIKQGLSTYKGWDEHDHNFARLGEDVVAQILNQKWQQLLQWCEHHQDVGVLRWA